MRRDVLAAYFFSTRCDLVGWIASNATLRLSAWVLKILNNKTDFIFLSFIFPRVWVGVWVFLSGDILLLVLRIFSDEFFVL
jgi:hypothetical protein